MTINLITFIIRIVSYIRGNKDLQKISESKVENMHNQTSLKISKRNEKIIENVYDFYSNGKQENHGHYYRYQVIFIDGVTYESNRLSDIDYTIKDAGRNEYNDILNGTRYTD